MPEATIAATPTTAPTISIIRKRTGLSRVNRNTQDSGNTVTMWNSAKLASGAKAPSTIVAGPRARTRLARCARAAVRGSRTAAAYSGVVDHAQAREQRHDVDREGDEERIAPAPVEEVVGRKVAGEDRRTARSPRSGRAARRAAGSSRTSRAGARGAFSASSEARPSQAPPAPGPGRCAPAPAARSRRSRSRHSRAGTRCATVEPPSRNSAMVSLTPRPYARSIAMKMTVPNGRATKASAKIAKE